VWVVGSGCNILPQNLNAHLSDVYLIAAARTPKNQRKNEGKFPARLAVHAKDGATSRKTDKLFVRFLKRSASQPR
jgi:hypothetical protein